MRDFRTYSPEDTIVSNLQETEQRRDTVCEQELAHLRELAAELLQENDLVELLHLLPEHRPPSFPPSESIPRENAERLLRLRPQHQLWRSLLFCREMSELLHAERTRSIAEFFSDTEEISDSATDCIVYQRSNYTDSAYLRFSPLLTEARAAYTHSFLSACEEVYNGRFEYCILPIENSAEGRLSGFLRLIRRYDLKIAATCDIAGIDADRITRFALLRKNLVPFLASEETCRYFEFSVPSYTTDSIGDLLSAARHYALRLDSIHSLPKTADEQEGTVHIALLSEQADLQSFLLYLAMEAPYYTPIGIYPHLEQKGR